MESIGVRQLQQNAATTVERVRLGESIEVTVRGRPVARLVPVVGTLLDQLEASGRLKRGKGDLLDLGFPAEATAGRGIAVGHSGEDAGKRTLMLYLDSSALLKLVIAEKESRALRSFLKREAAERVSCSLVRTEALRATRPHGAAALERARGLLQTLQLVQLDDVLLDAAGLLDPLKMRSLDAIHLAAAALIAPALTALVTYDKRTAEGAALLGFPVVSPA